MKLLLFECTESRLKPNVQIPFWYFKTEEMEVYETPTKTMNIVAPIILLWPPSQIV